MIDDGYQLASFLRFFLLGLEEDELEDELEERRFLDLFLCFFTFLCLVRAYFFFFTLDEDEEEEEEEDRLLRLRFLSKSWCTCLV